LLAILAASYANAAKTPKTTTKISPASWRTEFQMNSTLDVLVISIRDSMSRSVASCSFDSSGSVSMAEIDARGPLEGS